MDSKELRIGNYINFGSTVSEVFGIQAKEVMFKYSTGSEDKYAQLINEGVRPVLLTEEWLLKFSFVKEFYRINDRSVKEYYVEDFIWRLEDEIHLYFRDDSWWLMEEYDSLLSFKRKIKGLHDLQNLYFALTGKELTLK